MDTNRIFKDMNKAQIYTHTKKVLFKFVVQPT